MKNIDQHKINFYRRLKLLGFNSYNTYLKSPHWKNKVKEYKKSELPQYCLNCGDQDFTLHHRVYTRLGDEGLYDFIPLCKKCHNIIHKWLKDNNVFISANSVFRQAFGYSYKLTREIMKKISITGKSSTKFKDKTRINILSNK